VVKLDKTLNVEVIVFIIFILLIGCIFSYITLYKIIERADYISHAHVTFYTSPDTKWDDLPPFLKERLAKETASKANLKDLIQIRDMYNKMIVEYKEPVNIKETK
jgi:hypothetical protein